MKREILSDVNRWDYNFLPAAVGGGLFINLKPNKMKYFKYSDKMFYANKGNKTICVCIDITAMSPVSIYNGNDTAKDVRTLPKTTKAIFNAAFDLAIENIINLRKELEND
jgi:hypothetical protein